ncbi:hypothetical protein F2Q68_00042975 [Brassica cretica]|uniref:Uncharacterized protein n=1 Tax=Brassica cretica TaxID=69181 RepID=A0A8S9LGL0_BRACR|nr:hypothetical protein F2Q68_00042975 [Brassica cretica]
MDPNQTAGTTPSRVNDIDPTGSDSGTEVTPTRHRSQNESGLESGTAPGTDNPPMT